MISEDYVSFAVSKLLKEKGFNEIVGWSYTEDGLLLRNLNYDFECNNGIYDCPTLQKTMKWLRKKHKLCIVSIPVVTDDDGDGGCLWNYVISRKLKPIYESESLYESPEAALNDAAKYCLENLI